MERMDVQVDSEYRRIEEAIRYLEDHSEDQPGLAAVSRQVGLSPHHFQRVFKRWTGISPKRYLQFLTVESAKRHLERSASLLETACSTGLSGTGRLHDLFISIEAVTPGQFKSGGADMVLLYGFHNTPFGRALLAVTKDGGITDLAFVGVNEETVMQELRLKWPAAVVRRDDGATGELMGRLFEDGFRQGEDGRIRLVLRGTNFQIKVWQALLKIPEGAVVSYTDVARWIGRPDAVRAVACAVGSNPVAWLIPCHRVLRKSGETGGYRWGVLRKKMMLTRELAGKEGRLQVSGV